MLAARNGHAEVLQTLAEANADLHAADQDGVTALAAAAAEGHEPAVRQLLALKAGRVGAAEGGEEWRGNADKVPFGFAALWASPWKVSSGRERGERINPPPFIKPPPPVDQPIYWVPHSTSFWRRPPATGHLENVTATFKDIKQMGCTGGVNLNPPSQH